MMFSSWQYRIASTISVYTNMFKLCVHRQIDEGEVYRQAHCSEALPHSTILFNEKQI